MEVIRTLYNSHQETFLTGYYVVFIEDRTDFNELVVSLPIQEFEELGKPEKIDVSITVG